MFTAREVAAVLGLKTARLRSYLRAGFVAPNRGDDGELRFSFQDLALLRKAEGLVADRIPPRRVTATLRLLRERLPIKTPLSGVQLVAEGDRIIVHDGRVRWRPESGQVLLDFCRSEGNQGAPVTPLANARPAPTPANDGKPGPTTAQELYDRACAVEDSVPAEAQALYRQALAKDPNLADGHINLGRLLHEAGDLHAALLHYRAALKARPSDATAAFNVGVALEDLGCVEEAIDAYGKSLGCAPHNPDAHYNMARLLEHLGKPELAIRHLLLYRQLTRRKK